MRRKEKETKNAPKANIKPRKALKRRNQAKQRNEIKNAVFVYVTNDTQINNTNIYVYVCSVWCLHDTGRKREKKGKERVGKGATAPLIFKDLSTTAPLICEMLIFISLWVCVFGRNEQANNVGLLCVPGSV